MPKTGHEARDENCLKKWTTTIQTYIVENVDSIFEDAFQARYFHSNNGLKTAIFNVFEQTLCEMVRSGTAPTALEAQMRDLLHANVVDPVMVQEELLRSGFIVQIAETMFKLGTEPSTNSAYAVVKKRAR